MDNSQIKKNSWRILLEMILRDFRLSENDLSKLTGIQQSTINRITRGETKEPYPSTIKRLEDRLNIKINDSDNTRFTYSKKSLGEKRISDLENKKLISKADETPYFKLNKFPLIRIDIMDEYFQMAAREPKVDYDAMKSLATEYVLLPYPKNGIAGLIHQGECAPILNDGDIALFDPDEEIKENDLVGWTATSGKYGIGKISFSDKNDFVIQTLDGTTEHRINRKELTHIAKIVLTVRRW